MECVDIKECDASDPYHNCDELARAIPTEKAVLLLTTYVPILIKFNGEMSDKVFNRQNFKYGEGSEVDYSCGFTLNNEFYVAGGYKRPRQVISLTNYKSY